MGRNGVADAHIRVNALNLLIMLNLVYVINLNKNMHAHNGAI